MHEFVVIIFGDWEIVDRMGTRSRTWYSGCALCDPSYTLTTTVRFICVSSSEGVTPRKGGRAGKTNATIGSGSNYLSQNGNSGSSSALTIRSKQNVPESEFLR